jgi:UDP-2,3-diacylglucosamine hydrolase
MLENVACRPGPVFFLSDAHLGAPVGPPDREDTLLALIGTAQREAGALFILGDLFDFWFEYRHAVPKGTFRVAHALRGVVEAGIPVVYLGGNHDFWIGSYLQEELGVRSYLHPIEVRLQGRLVHLAHGDGLGPGDLGYKFIKRVLRHPWAIAGYRSLHPDLGIPLARRFSTTSRRFTEPREILLPKILRDVARPRLRGEISAMVMGHVHYPTHCQGEGRDFVIAGDWLESFTHARLIGGRFHLYKLESGQTVEIPPEAFPAGFWGKEQAPAV